MGAEGRSRGHVPQHCSQRATKAARKTVSCHRFTVPMLKGLAHSRNAVARLELPYGELDPLVREALLELVHCAGAGQAGSAQGGGGSLKTLDLRRVYDVEEGAELRAACQARGVQLLLDGDHDDDAYDEREDEGRGHDDVSDTEEDD